MQENTDFSKMTEMRISRTYARSSGKLCASSIVETPRQVNQYYYTNTDWNREGIQHRRSIGGGAIERGGAPSTSTTAPKIVVSRSIGGGGIEGA